MMAMLAALIITFSASAQSTPAKKDSKPATTQSKPADKPADKPAGDARTKTGDKINKDLKGPNGETVYTGPKGGNYYLNKSGNKTYLKSDAKPATTPAKK